MKHHSLSTPLILALLAMPCVAAEPDPEVSTLKGWADIDNLKDDQGKNAAESIKSGGQCVALLMAAMSKGYASSTTGGGSMYGATVKLSELPLKNMVKLVGLAKTAQAKKGLGDPALRELTAPAFKTLGADLDYPSLLILSPTGDLLAAINAQTKTPEKVAKQAQELAEGVAACHGLIAQADKLFDKGMSPLAVKKLEEVTKQDIALSHARLVLMGKVKPEAPATNPPTCPFFPNLIEEKTKGWRTAMATKVADARRLKDSGSEKDLAKALAIASSVAKGPKDWDETTQAQVLIDEIKDKQKAKK